MAGTPSDEPLKNIAWRVADVKDMGLLWFAPSVEALGARVRRVMDLATPLFARYRFELPVTFTLVTPERMVGAISISFDKTRPEELDRAHALYRALKEALAKEGIYGYRSGVQGMGDIAYPHPGHLDFLRALKRTTDPHAILSPGKYGL